jgi:hypothetical protein
MTIALIAHDSKKELMVQFCTAYCRILSQHKLVATGTTGKLISEATGLQVQRFLAGVQGGDQQIASRIACNEIDLLLFFRDPINAKPCEVRLCSDSQYVINGLEKGWAKGWKRRGWKKADGSPALNPDLWAQALEQEARHKITYVWVKGHAGHPENERCDQLAVAQSKAHGGRQGT